MAWLFRIGVILLTCQKIEFQPVWKEARDRIGKWAGKKLEISRAESGITARAPIWFCS